MQTAQTSAWLDLTAARRVQTADEAPPITHASTVGLCLQKHFAHNRLHSWGRKIDGLCLESWGTELLWGPGDNTQGLHLGATHHPHQHLSWVPLQVTQGSQPPSHCLAPCPALTCWGHMKSSEKRSCLVLPTLTWARESSEGEGDKRLVDHRARNNFSSGRAWS